MEFKGTKGKFEVVEHSWSDTSLYCGDYCIATKSIYDEATEENQEQLELEVSLNFKLLSKAPEMLEMLKINYDYFEELAMLIRCDDWTEDFRVKWTEIMTNLEKLIDNATNI